jgi:hypothetical protein
MKIRKIIEVDIDNIIFRKTIGEEYGNVYVIGFGEYIPNTNKIKTFDELIDVALNFLNKKGDEE